MRHAGGRTFLILLLGAGLLLPHGATAKGDKGDIEFVGFLAGLPAGGLTLPPSSTVTAQIELLAERGSTRLSFNIDFTPQTKVELESETVQNGQLVEVELAVQDGRLVVKEIEEAEIGRFPGTLADVPGGTLTLPVSSDQTVTLHLGGSASIPIPFVITPRTESDFTTLTNGDQVMVELGIVSGRLIAVEIEEDD